MIKSIKPNNKIFSSPEFQKDKYKFFLILKNLGSSTLELYSDEENYILCRGSHEYPTWIWTKDNFDKALLPEIEEAIDLYRLDKDTRFTCKRELYKALEEDKYDGFGDYFFEMGYLVCNNTVSPKKTDGHMELASRKDKDTLVDFIYKESKEISDVKSLTIEEAEKQFEKIIDTGTYYVWKDANDKIVCQANYSVIDGNAKMAGVYTTPEARGKGYAANIIYQLTNKALSEGYHVSLYTDYNYVPSNKAYKNVGYIDEDVLINFSCSKAKIDEDTHMAHKK